jgi:hypothetical protein
LRNSFCINLPIIGIIKAVVIEPGINNKPASVAVHPKMDCVYIGIINVEPYKPKPSMSFHKSTNSQVPSLERLNLQLILIG